VVSFDFKNLKRVKRELPVEADNLRKINNHNSTTMVTTDQSERGYPKQQPER
jgi:hypothetical protein